jgi:hypothetical protein
MGFMDKAKKMAEQAQTKLDEAQTKFNESQQAGAAPPSAEPVVEYDSAGRPITAGGDPPAGPSVAPPPGPAPAAPDVAEAPAAPVEAAAPHPKAPAAPPSEPLEKSSEGAGEYAPPKLSSGDPLAG